MRNSKGVWRLEFFDQPTSEIVDNQNDYDEESE